MTAASTGKSVPGQDPGTGLEHLIELTRFARSLTTPPMSFDQFVDLSLRFPDLRIEQEPNGQITIMPPVFSGSGYREGEAFGLVWQWNRQTRLGKTFSPSTGVHLRDGSTKQADTIWISNEKINSIDPARLDAAFLPLEPDFVIEIRSKTDDLDKLKSKMTDSWIANGVRLAWLIDPYEEKAWVYRSNGSVDVTESFDEKKLSGEEVLPGFELDLAAFKIV